MTNNPKQPQSEGWKELDRIMHGANPVQLHTLKIHLGLLLDEVASSTRERTIAEVVAIIRDYTIGTSIRNSTFGMKELNNAEFADAIISLLNDKDV